MQVRSVTLVLLGALVGPAPAVAQLRIAVANGAPLDQTIDSAILQARSPATARLQFEEQLSSEIEKLDRACKLTHAQKQKLQLVGRGDIKRFFDRLEVVKRQTLLPQRAMLPAVNGPAGANGEVRVVILPQEAMPLQKHFQSGLFHEDALLYKTLRYTLTNEQYDTLTSNRPGAKHLDYIKTVARMLQGGASFNEEQSRQLVALMVKEMKPSLKPGPYETYRILDQFSRVPQEKWRNLFGDVQWQGVQQQLARYGAMVQKLRIEGTLPPEPDDYEDSPRSDPVHKK